MPKITITGLDTLQKKLKQNIKMQDVQRVVRHNGSQLQRKMQRKADFHGHFEWKAGKGKVFKKPTGTTKRSITLSLSDGNFTATVEPTTEYSPYLEYGTRFMEAQPFVRPAFEEQKEIFKEDMKKLVK